VLDVKEERRNERTKKKPRVVNTRGLKEGTVGRSDAIEAA
jgi:hypothetical protein